MDLSVKENLTRELNRKLEELARENRNEFIELLLNYDSSKEVFTTIIQHANKYHGMTLNMLASVGMTTVGSASRWTRGASPGQSLGRKAVIEKLVEHLKSYG